MTVKVANNLAKALDLVTKLASNFGVNTIATEDNKVTITYKLLGQGSTLTNLIGDTLDKELPEFDYNIKIIPSDLTLIVRLS